MLIRIIKFKSRFESIKTLLWNDILKIINNISKAWETRLSVNPLAPCARYRNHVQPRKMTIVIPNPNPIEYAHHTSEMSYLFRTVSQSLTIVYLNFSESLAMCNRITYYKIDLPCSQCGPPIPDGHVHDPEGGEIWSSVQIPPFWQRPQASVVYSERK